MLFLRSLIFNIAFYVNLILHLVAGLVALLLPRSVTVRIVKSWVHTSLWLLRVICDLKIEVRGREKIPAGGIVVAAKHQSIWETFMLPILFDDPVFIVKRELMWIPVFGWMASKTRAIPVNRSGRASAMVAMLKQARQRIEERRQIVIFPEGTRRAAGAEPAYKFGVARMYAILNTVCVPVALNSGVFWPRRTFMRYPGTIVVDILDPIPPGLDSRAFFDRLQSDIESATARLVAEAKGQGAGVDTAGRAASSTP
ncbi:MAG: 1-acyl-sn-glycerol-3-phosphate acyltransferase [Rhizobiales bacterium]|nr:1-acyl-sn-glycerol-3-phosphate acyltransferase [Hyphomicrobiales bacterium]